MDESFEQRLQAELHAAAARLKTALEGWYVKHLEGHLPGEVKQELHAVAAMAVTDPNPPAAPVPPAHTQI